jgi:cyclohexa-1,5-dienecarbonyl-CoA hydratase
VSETPLKVWLERGGALLRLRLARPRANVLDAQMTAALAHALDAHRDNPGLVAALLDHEGAHFSFGASVAEHLPEHCAAMLRNFHSLLERLLDWPRPVLVAARGQCLGGGLELAAFCNFILCDRTAKFGQPEIKLGVWPPPATLLLPARIGQARADDLILTGRSIDAETALSWGLVTAVGDEVDALADAFLREHILPKSASSLRHANLAARRALYARLREELPRVQDAYLTSLMATHDANEGIDAFIARREPEWKHA